MSNNTVTPNIISGFSQLQPTSLGVTRGFLFADGTAIAAQATISEKHIDEIVITEHPVEQSAQISDHMYRKPQEVIITCGFSNSPTAPSDINQIGSIQEGFNEVDITSSMTGNSLLQCNQIYDMFISMQQTGQLISVATGKRIYPAMLFKMITVETDIKTENALIMTIVCHEIILATTSTVTIPNSVNPNAQTMPESTAPVSDQGTTSLTTTPAGYSPSIAGSLGLDPAGFAPGTLLTPLPS